MTRPYRDPRVGGGRHQCPCDTRRRNRLLVDEALGPKDIDPNGNVGLVRTRCRVSENDGDNAGPSRPSSPEVRRYRISREAVRSATRADKPAKNGSSVSPKLFATGDGVSNCFGSNLGFTSRRSLVPHERSGPIDWPRVRCRPWQYNNCPLLGSREQVPGTHGSAIERVRRDGHDDRTSGEQPGRPRLAAIRSNHPDVDPLTRR